MWKPVLALAMLPGVAMAAAEDANGCHGLAGAAERLACYDLQTGYAADAAPAEAATADAPAAAPAGSWRVAAEESALDGRKDVWLSVTSDNSQPNQIGSPERATLWVRCMGNTTAAFVAFNDYTSDDQTVKYRLDEDGVKSVWMQTMNGGEGIGLWSGKAAIPFIKGLLDKEKLVVAYKSYSNHNLEFVFPVTGLGEQVGDLAAACGWAP